MKVLFIPATAKAENPYLQRLASSLEDTGADVCRSWSFPNTSWLFKNRNQCDIIHVHWVSCLYRLKRLTWLRSLVVMTRFCFAKALGYKIVWTCHNLLPHETEWPSLDRFFRRHLMQQADGVIFHCQWARNEAIRLFGEPRYDAVIPHGNFSGCYPDPPARLKARRELGLPFSSNIFLCFGQIRGYKGLTRVVKEFTSLDNNCVLLVAGGGSPEAESALRTQSQSHSHSHSENVRLLLGFVPDAEVPTYFSAADVLLTPYETVTTSGTAILGLTYGLPVIAPALGCLPELLASGGGILYDPGQPDGLLRAIKEFLNSDRNALAKRARQAAEKLDWQRIGSETAFFYARVVGKTG
jgi:beta-1,4-mannosyltransferase